MSEKTAISLDERDGLRAQLVLEEALRSLIHAGLSEDCIREAMGKAIETLPKPEALTANKVVEKLREQTVQGNYEFLHSDRAAELIDRYVQQENDMAESENDGAWAKANEENDQHIAEIGRLQSLLEVRDAELERIRDATSDRIGLFAGYDGSLVCESCGKSFSQDHDPLCRVSARRANWILSIPSNAYEQMIKLPNDSPLLVWIRWLAESYARELPVSELVTVKQ